MAPLGFVVSGEFDSLVDLSGELFASLRDEVLFEGVEFSESEVFLDLAVSAKEKRGGEVVDVDTGEVLGLDVGALDNFLAVHGADDGVGESSGSVCHRKGGRSATGLGLDDFGSSVLDSLGERRDFLSVERVDAAGGLDLGKNGDDGDSGVASDDWDVDVVGVLGSEDGDELVGTDDIESGDTVDSGSINAELLVDLGGNGHGRVDGVADDTDNSVGGGLGAGSGELSDDGGVSVEKIVSGHAWLSWDTGRDENNISALDGFLHSGRVSTDKSGDSGFGVDVGKVGGDTGSDWVDIKASNVGDGVVALEEKGKRLSDSSGSAENSNVLVDLGGGGEGTGGSSGQHSVRQSKSDSKMG